MNSKNIYFSIICPTFNSSKFIKRNYISLENQKYRNFEVIYVDDESVDDTVNIIQNLTKNNKKFKIIKSKHVGPGQARNIGITIAKFQWIAFIDSDDTWHQNKLNEIAKIIKVNKNYNYYLHWEKLIQLDNNNRILKHGIRFSNSMNISKQLYKSNFLSTSAVVCRKFFFYKYGFFDQSLPNAQDYDLWLKHSPFIKLKIVKKVLGKYYQTKDSITERCYNKKIFSELRIAIRYRKYYKFYIIKILKIVFSKRWFM